MTATIQGIDTPYLVDNKWFLTSEQRGFSIRQTSLARSLPRQQHTTTSESYTVFGFLLDQLPQSFDGPRRIVKAFGLYMGNVLERRTRVWIQLQGLTKIG